MLEALEAFVAKFQNFFFLKRVRRVYYFFNYLFLSPSPLPKDKR